MSGPCSVFIFGDPFAALLAAAGIRAAESIAQGYATAAALRGLHAAAHAAHGAAQTTAGQHGLAALEHEARAAEARFEQLVEHAERLGAQARVQATRPVRPAAQDFLTLAAYTRALQELSSDLQQILLTEAARLAGDGDDDGAMPIRLVAPTAMTMPAPSRSRRLLDRIAHLGPPPADIDALARELDASPPGERAALLATELRLRIQARAEAVQKQLLLEATATILRQSLKDLGYEVEPVAGTLFVEGGIVHFRKTGWGDYMVRMRVDAGGAAANFNVIRAIDAGIDERSVLDHIAEDRWCAEFPVLLKALAHSGIHMSVARRLEAGEVPVQLVDRSRLPRFVDDGAAAPTPEPRARALK